MASYSKPPFRQENSAITDDGGNVTLRSETAVSMADGRGALSGAILKTESLSVHFGGLAALSQVNFAAVGGEIRAIIGPNGAGKSTFFNCLRGVLRPNGGRIIIDGE